MSNIIVPEYSEPTIVRDDTSTTIEYDVKTDTYYGWDSIRVEKTELGIRIDCRCETLEIPTQFVGIVAEEIARLAVA